MDSEDRISEIFRDKNVLITGGSGFLGKLLVDKLLRCTEVKTVYLLMREKKGKAPEERLKDVFSNMIFDVLKQTRPSAMAKCRIIPGDVSAPDLALSPENRRLLEEQVHFIYHSAASTRFDDSVKRAVCFNTRSTQLLLELAARCKHLQAFVHVSTAYAFPNEKVLYEKPYRASADAHRVIEAINDNNEAECEPLLGDCPNTYTFSKALAEQLVVEQMEKLPVIIVRPSVVCPTLRDPIPGWCNNLQGPMGLFVGAGKGIIRSMYMKGDTWADFVPADMVINGIIISTWNYLTMEKSDRIVNLTSSSEYNLSWEAIIELGKEVVYKHVPFNGVVWYPGGSIKKSRFLHNICFYLFQIVPAIFIDALLLVLGYKPILFQIQRRIQKGSEVFEYYTTKPWNFSSLKKDNFLVRMNEKEKEIYKLDAQGLDLTEYFKNCILCVRRNNLKETDDTLPAARRHMKVMYALDVICKIVFVLGVFYYIYKWILAPRIKI